MPQLIGSANSRACSYQENRRRVRHVTDRLAGELEICLDQRGLDFCLGRLVQHPRVSVARGGPVQQSSVCAVPKCCSTQLRCGSSALGVPRLTRDTTRHSSGAVARNQRPTSEPRTALGTARHRSAALDPASDPNTGRWDLGTSATLDLARICGPPYLGTHQTPFPRLREWTWTHLGLRPLPPRRLHLVRESIPVLDDVQVPAEESAVLKNGPKYSVQPTIPAHELLSLNRRLASRAESEDGERCILDGADILKRTVSKERRRERDPMDTVVSYLRKNDLRLAVADKEGGFVLMTKGHFDLKAAEAVEKNFRRVQMSSFERHRRQCSSSVTTTTTVARPDLSAHGPDEPLPKAGGGNGGGGDCPDGAGWTIRLRYRLSMGV
ncbi:hypothetical protein HPB50_003279 [Hyalomma asiaticum]|uniref:Uncharacterized protein n=1 Tax=Hyalomma asiaticum TaxID=266040 RepID=A0ACB7S030_HYAAI|nr:hypothetical protein HPB50_003279 [Hyalomma asiaticum]